MTLGKMVGGSENENILYKVSEIVTRSNGGVGENIKCHKSMTQIFCVFLVRVLIITMIILHIEKIAPL